MKNLKKLASCLLSAVMVFSAAAVIPAVPASAAKTKAVKKLKKPTKFKAQLKTVTPYSGLEAYIDTCEVKLSWKKVKKAKKYEIYRAKLNAKGKGKFKKLTALKKVKYIDDSIKSGNYYKYKVRAVSGKVKSKFTAASKKLGYMERPDAAAQINEAATAVRISWNKAEGATAYKIYKSDNRGKSYKLLKNSKTFKKDGGTLYYDDAAVKKGGHYFYYMVAYNAKMSSKKSSVSRVIYNDYHIAVQVGDTKSLSTFTPYLNMSGSTALTDFMTIESEDESIVTAKIDTDASGKSEIKFTGVKAGYTYVKMKTEISGQVLSSSRIRVKVTDEPAYDLTVKKGESMEIYDLDAYKDVAAMYNAMGVKLKVNVTSNDSDIVSVTNPSSLSCKLNGVSEGEVLVKIKISLNVEGEDAMLVENKILVKVE